MWILANLLSICFYIYNLFQRQKLQSFKNECCFIHMASDIHTLSLSYIFFSMDTILKMKKIQADTVDTYNVLFFTLTLYKCIYIFSKHNYNDVRHSLIVLYFQTFYWKRFKKASNLNKDTNHEAIHN